ncbi:MAG TPA: alpha/beta fold hydrolase [Usitatibacter sp.]
MAATPVVFLPGLLEDAEVFAAQAGQLSATAPCRVADLTRDDTIAGMASRALDDAPAGKLCIAGHSMGGYVALEMLRQAPGRIERAAFLCTNARPDPPESTENRKRLMALAEKDLPSVVRTLIPKLLTDAHTQDAAMTGAILRMAERIGTEAFMRQERAIIARIDSRPHLAAIRCPTLVVAARHDAIMPVAWLVELAAGIAGANLAIVEDSGHVPMIEQPAGTTRLLLEWLGG